MASKSKRKWLATKSLMTSFNYIWKIENFSKCLQCSTTTSAVFRGAGYNWSLTLTCKDASGVDKENVALKLMASDDAIVARIYHNNSVLVRASYDASIINSYGYKVNRVIGRNTFHNFTPSVGVCYDKFVQRSDLLDDAFSLLPSDTLTIHCKIRVLTNNDVHPSDCCSMSLPSVPSCRLKQDLNAVLGEGLFSDVTLCVQGRRLLAHRAILAGQSSVFRAMFEHDMKERKDACVVIEDVGVDAASDMLSFLYTGSAPNVSSLASELLVAADKYNIPRLKSICEQQLSQCIQLQDAATLLIDADTFNAPQLKSCALFWIARHVQDVMKTDG